MYLNIPAGHEPGYGKVKNRGLAMNQSGNADQGSSSGRVNGGGRASGGGTVVNSGSGVGSAPGTVHPLHITSRLCIGQRFPNLTKSNNFYCNIEAELRRAVSMVPIAPRP
jgi:hypothetical protein